MVQRERRLERELRGVDDEEQEEVDLERVGHFGEEVSGDRAEDRGRERLELRLADLKRHEAREAQEERYECAQDARAEGWRRAVHEREAHGGHEHGVQGERELEAERVEQREAVRGQWSDH